MNVEQKTVVIDNACYYVRQAAEEFDSDSGGFLAAAELLEKAANAAAFTAGLVAARVK